jgi:tRNA G18 (ribose-2'-O)-methylase SpoU
MRHAVVVLHNIRSTHNVGSIFRTADAAGVSKIYLTGYTPAPLDRFGRSQKDIAKTALGAERSVTWEQAKDPFPVITRLKEEDFQVIAVEQAKDSADYRRLRPKAKVAFLFGNEVRGLSKALLAQCDAIAEIPMAGKKESLNVSVAAGVALFRMLGR